MSAAIIQTGPAYRMTEAQFHQLDRVRATLAVLSAVDPGRLAQVADPGDMEQVLDNLRDEMQDVLDQVDAWRRSVRAMADDDGGLPDGVVQAHSSLLDSLPRPDVVATDVAHVHPLDTGDMEARR